VKVVIHDRTDGLPARMRAYTESKLIRLSRHFDKVLEAEVEFDSERKRSQEPARVVRITVRAVGRKMSLINARETGPDLQATLDRALDKVDRQIVKLKERIKARKKKAQVLDPEPVRPAVDAVPERVRMRLLPESIEDAEAALASNGQIFHVFLNEDSGEINIAYRRTDGRLAVIEPRVP
jgi:putative sigma-54 modulation protein